MRMLDQSVHMNTLNSENTILPPEKFYQPTLLPTTHRTVISMIFCYYIYNPLSIVLKIPIIGNAKLLLVF